METPRTRIPKSGEGAPKLFRIDVYNRLKRKKGLWWHKVEKRLALYKVVYIGYESEMILKDYTHYFDDSEGKMIICLYSKLVSV